MNKKNNLCILLCMLVIISVCSTVFAEDRKEVVISNVGTVSIPSQVDVSDVNFNGLKANNLVAKDNNVFRSTIVIGVQFNRSTSPSLDLENTDLVQMLESFMNSFSTSSRGSVLKITPAKKIDLATKKVVVADRTILMQGVAYGVNAYVTKNENDLSIIVFMSPDGDCAYWEPVRSTILTTVK